MLGSTRRGNMGVMMAAVMVGAFIFISFMLPSFGPTQAGSPEADVAVSLANEIKTLPPVDNQVCQGIPSALSNALTILQEMDKSWGTSFGPIQIDTSNCDVVVGYLPIVGAYDSLVTAAWRVDPNNATSVRDFYVKAFLLSSDLVILNDRIAYNYAFKSTGELNNALGLARLRSLCGDDCYSTVLSGIHWVIRGYTVQFLCQFDSLLSRYSPVPLDAGC